MWFFSSSSFDLLELCLMLLLLLLLLLSGLPISLSPLSLSVLLSSSCVAHILPWFDNWSVFGVHELVSSSLSALSTHINTSVQQKKTAHTGHWSMLSMYVCVCESLCWHIFLFSPHHLYFLHHFLHLFCPLNLSTCFSSICDRVHCYSTSTIHTGTLLNFPTDNSICFLSLFPSLSQNQKNIFLFRFLDVLFCFWLTFDVSLSIINFKAFIIMGHSF